MADRRNIGQILMGLGPLGPRSGPGFEPTVPGGVAFLPAHRGTIFRERGKINAQVTGRLVESLSGIRVVKGFNAEDNEKAAFAEGVESLLTKKNALVLCHEPQRVYDHVGNL